MSRGTILAVMLLALAILAGCNSAKAGTPQVDVRERFVLVGFSGQKAPDDSTRVYNWVPALAIGGDRVVWVYPAHVEQPREIFVAWPGGAVEAAELDGVHPDYNLTFLRAPGGRRYPEIEQPSAPLAPGDRVTVLGYFEQGNPPWDRTRAQTNEPRPPGDLGPLVELEGTVISPGMRRYQQTATGSGLSEEGAYLVLNALNPEEAMISRSAVVRNGELYGWVMWSLGRSRPNVEVWAVPTVALLGGKAELGTEVPSAGGRVPLGPMPTRATGTNR